MKIIELIQHGKSMGTRELGEQIRKNALTMIKDGNEVLFDFKGIDIISSAFADELFGKLYIELGEGSFKNNVKVNNFDNEDVKKIILLIINKGINFRKNNS